MAQTAKRPSPVSALVYVALICLGVWRLIWPGDSSTITIAAAWMMIIGGVIGLILDLFVRFLPATTPEEAAASLLEQEIALYAGAHEYRRVEGERHTGLGADFHFPLVA